MDQYKVDIFLNNRIKVRQFVNGYRFSMDPFLLAAHICSVPNFRILDVGCGSGIIALLLACQHESVQVFGVEIQKALADISLSNSKLNKLQKRFQVLNKNISQIFYKDLGSKMDLVVSNPPYIKRGAGRVSSNHQNAIARHEITMDVKLLCVKAFELTGINGSLAVVFPADRLGDLKTAMQEIGFSVNCLRFVYTREDKSPKLVLVLGTKIVNSVAKILPPLHIFDGDGSHSEEYNDMIFHGQAWYPIIEG